MIISKNVKQKFTSYTQMAAYETYETDTVYDEMIEQQNPTVETVSFLYWFV